jgi:hypothetical protein
VKPKWVRIVGVISAVFVALLFALSSMDVLGSSSRNDLIIFYLTLIICPSFAVIILNVFGRFWWSFAISIWLLFFAIIAVFEMHASPKTLILVLAILTVCTTPFLNRAAKSREGGRIDQSIRQKYTQRDGAPDRP